MANLSANLMAAWGDESGSEPDPNTFPGLLSMAESRLEESKESFRELAVHFDSLHQRILDAQNNIKVMLAKAGRLPDEMAEAGQENLEAFEEIITPLENLLALGPESDIDIYWDQLGDLEEASERLRAANQRLAEAANSAQA